MTQQVSDLVPGLDLTSVGGMAVLAYLVVGVIKRAWPTWATGKEEVLALSGAVAIGMSLKKFGGAFGDVAYGSLLVQLLLAGVFAQLIHDKLMNPVIKQLTPAQPTDVSATAK